MIDWDAPFLPDDDDERLLPGGRRDDRNLVVPIRDPQGRITDYEVNF